MTETQGSAWVFIRQSKHRLFPASASTALSLGGEDRAGSMATCLWRQHGDSLMALLYNTNTLWNKFEKQIV